MGNDYGQRETEFSKKWVEENNGLFTTTILEFMAQHPQDYWALDIAQTNGFITIRAKLIKR